MSDEITREETFSSHLGETAKKLLLKMQRKNVHRSGLGPDIDALSVKEARDVSTEIDKELARVAKYQEKLIQLKAEVVVSVR